MGSAVKLGDAEYTKLVDKLMHKRTLLTESECKSEVESIQGGAVSSFEGEPIGTYAVVPGGVQITLDPPKKKRGRPPGSRNRPRSGDKQ